MNLRHLELEDQPWFPKTIKESMTDYLRFLFHTFKLYHPVNDYLINALDRCNSDRVIDLCSGSGGAIENVLTEVSKKYNKNISFVLTDLYPRIEAYQYLAKKYGDRISFIHYPVDALNVPGFMNGFRTIFSGIHHFSPAEVKAVLQNSIKAKQGIAVFDGGNKNLFMILLILVFHPLALAVFTPFIKPFRWSRLLFTYLIPVIPISSVWDGIISIINLYTPSQLLSIGKVAGESKFIWEAGKLKTKFGLSISYLIGFPNAQE